MVFDNVEVDAKLTKQLIKVIPDVVVSAWQDGINLMVGGSFVRKCIHPGEEVGDIDLYGDSKVVAKMMSKYETKAVKPNSVDLDVPEEMSGGLKVNLITNPYTVETYLTTVDFTISSAILWMDKISGKPCLSAHVDWEKHVREKSIVYMQVPGCRADAGHSMGRVLKLYKRGYTIGPINLAKIICDLVSRVEVEGQEPLFVNDAVVRATAELMGNTEGVEDVCEVSGS